MGDAVVFRVHGQNHFFSSFIKNLMQNRDIVCLSEHIQVCLITCSLDKVKQSMSVWFFALGPVQTDEHIKYWTFQVNRQNYTHLQHLSRSLWQEIGQNVLPGRKVFIVYNQALLVLCNTRLRSQFVCLTLKVSHNKVLSAFLHATVELPLHMSLIFSLKTL